ncbi:Acetate kinase [Candidatus Providencia siddallii]|uniref:Acetate kinase n=1 Tax=Candidatus Providencia siddallii TaxID=1715285 RepID=A0A0M6W7M0_9GAMM|nr:Acetate kinase [Candidatus Providencia siddallii]
MINQIILIINCGSSSIKFAVINLAKKEKILSGLAECFNLPNSYIEWKINSIKEKTSLCNYASHRDALDFIINTIFAKNFDLYQKITAIGHRVVHGGEKFTSSVIITDDVIKNIEAAIPFAPLHNPANLIGIKETRKLFPHLINKNVAVFDTAFHQTMKEEAYLYAIPYELYLKHKIRRYGAHGISHYYVSKEAAKKLNKPFKKINVITCHLGNGCSIAAIVNGKCVDTSMGLTPLEGLVMGTRSGDIDPAIIFYLYKHLGKNIDQISQILTKESGLFGLTGITNDYRFIEKNYNKKEEAKRAMNIFCHRLAKYICAYSSLMKNRLDAIIFTGGIGENSIQMRKIILKKIKILGFEYEHKRNLSIRFEKEGLITTDSSIPALVIPTNEELVIAKDTAKLV